MKLLKSASRYIGSCTINGQRVLNLTGDKVLDQCSDWERAVPYRDVPGPTPLPLLGNTWRFIPYIGDFEIEHVDKVSRRLYEKYGKVVKVGGLLGRPDMLFLFDPDEIEKVFRNEDIMPYRPSMPSLNYYKHVYRKEFFGNNAGVIAVHGQDWWNFRSKVNQVMLQPRVAKMYVKSIAKTAEEFSNRINRISDKNYEVPPDFLNELHKWSLESIAKVALDVRLGCLDEHAHPDTQRLIDAVNTFFINVPVLELKIPFWRLFNTPTFKKYIEALDVIREITMKHVEIALERTKGEESNGELSVLQRVMKVDNNPKTASNLALDMFLVGIDTTSNAAASILYQLALHQDKQAILREELLTAFSTEDPILTHDDLEQLHYLKACIKETMRMFPVVIGNGRCTSNDCIIAGYQIPKGVQVIFQHYVMSNLEEYFQNSQEFMPERWLKSYSGCKHHPFASLPFGYGKRMCLGRRFADLELQILLTKILRKYRVEYHYKNLDYHIHPMYTPNGPLRLRFIPNNS